MKNKQLFLSLVVVLVLMWGMASVSLAQEAPSALSFTMTNIEGEEVSLSKYEGKVVVLVNVASKCGFTSQYEQLQELHADYAEKGVAVIGVPCNQFSKQEPGTDKEILAFCQGKYGVEFNMMSKVDVNGEDQCDLYKHLNGMDVSPKGKGDVSWNFEKYIIDRSGVPVARFASKVNVDSKEFVAAIEAALGDAAVGEATLGAAGSGGHYSHESGKLGRSYYLFSKAIRLKNSDKIQTIYFFAKDPNNAKGTPLAAVPEGKVVSETKTGMLVLKNKAGKKK